MTRAPRTRSSSRSTSRTCGTRSVWRSAGTARRDAEGGARARLGRGSGGRPLTGGVGPVFVDAKLHDIPNTVERASANIARLGVRMFNVHALGGGAMMEAAVRGSRRGADAAGVEPPLVVAVTVLSSQTGEDLASPASLAWEARQAGLDGVVVRGRTFAMCATHAAMRSVSSFPASDPRVATATIRCAC